MRSLIIAVLLFFTLNQFANAQPVYGIIYVESGTPKDVASHASLLGMQSNLNAGVLNQAWSYKLIEVKTFSRAREVSANKDIYQIVEVVATIYHGITDQNNNYYGQVADTEHSLEGLPDVDVDPLMDRPQHCGNKFISTDDIARNIVVYMSQHNGKTGTYPSATAPSVGAAPRDGGSGSGHYVSLTYTTQYGTLQDRGGDLPVMITILCTVTVYVWISDQTGNYYLADSRGFGTISDDRVRFFEPLGELVGLLV